MDLNELRQLLDTGAGMILATRDKNLWPDLCNVLGLELSEDASRLTAFINRDHATQSLQNIADNGRVAISLSRPCTFKAAQLKGQVLNICSVTEENKKKSQQWAERYRKEIQLIGVTHEAAMGLHFDADTALEIAVENIFIQTPGTQAGEKMERP